MVWRADFTVSSLVPVIEPLVSTTKTKFTGSGSVAGASSGRARPAFSAISTKWVVASFALNSPGTAASPWLTATASPGRGPGTCSVRSATKSSNRICSCPMMTPCSMRSLTPSADRVPKALLRRM